MLVMNMNSGYTTIMLSGPHLILVDDISIVGLINEIHVCTLSP